MCQLLFWDIFVARTCWPVCSATDYLFNGGGKICCSLEVVEIDRGLFASARCVWLGCSRDNCKSCCLINRISLQSFLLLLPAPEPGAYISQGATALFFSIYANIFLMRVPSIFCRSSDLRLVMEYATDEKFWASCSRLSNLCNLPLILAFKKKIAEQRDYKADLSKIRCIKLFCVSLKAAIKLFCCIFHLLNTAIFVSTCGSLQQHTASS